MFYSPNLKLLRFATLVAAKSSMKRARIHPIQFLGIIGHPSSSCVSLSIQWKLIFGLLVAFLGNFSYSLLFSKGKLKATSFSKYLKSLGLSMPKKKNNTKVKYLLNQTFLNSLKVLKGKILKKYLTWQKIVKILQICFRKCCNFLHQRESQPRKP